jgi:hypothetical protein
MLARSHNCHAFRRVSRQFVLLYRELDLFGRELLAIDGTTGSAMISTSSLHGECACADFSAPADVGLEEPRRVSKHDGAAQRQESQEILSSSSVEHCGILRMQPRHRLAPCARAEVDQIDVAHLSACIAH